MPNSLLLRGVEEFNHGHFFEAHEIWEELWNETVDDEKRFYQGLIQLAAGYHKLSLANYRGARKLLERGQQILITFPADYAGLDLSPLLATTKATLHRLVGEETPTD